MLPIHHTFAPLADRRQIRLCLGLLLQPWKWRDPAPVRMLEEAMEQTFGGKAFAFGSGREALVAILRSMRCQPGEEVIVQGYTCVVVPNAIVAAGMVPVFADIEQQTLNLDLAAVQNAITPKTRAIICQHTFGIPAFAKALRDLCDRHSLLLIEDCAHVLPDNGQPSEIAAHGDALLLSFGRDKAISGVAGGMAVVRREELWDHLALEQRGAKERSLFSIKRFLLYPLLYTIAKPLYGSGIGKLLLFFANRMRLLPKILTRGEKEGRMHGSLTRMPGACAVLALDQWQQLGTINNHRRLLTRFYFEETAKRNWPTLLGITPDLPLQKFPLFVKHAEGIRQRLKKQNIHLHDGWTGCVICPTDVCAENLGYKDGQDPAAEMAGLQILSLPTHPDMTLQQAQKLMELLEKAFYNDQDHTSP